jgi:hypothetical protein
MKFITFKISILPPLGDIAAGVAASLAPLSGCVPDCNMFILYTF